MLLNCVKQTNKKTPTHKNKQTLIYISDDFAKKIRLNVWIIFDFVI